MPLNTAVVVFGGGVGLYVTAADNRGARDLQVTLTVPAKLVYTAHDYGAPMRPAYAQPVHSLWRARDNADHALMLGWG